MCQRKVQDFYLCRGYGAATCTTRIHVGEPSYVNASCVIKAPLLARKGQLQTQFNALPATALSRRLALQIQINEINDEIRALECTNLRTTQMRQVPPQHHLCTPCHAARNDDADSDYGSNNSRGSSVSSHQSTLFSSSNGSFSSASSVGSH